MNANVKFILDLAAVFVPIGAAMMVAIWRSSIRLRENTAAVKTLAESINGTVVSAGLQQRVRELEDYVLAQRTRAEIAREQD